MTGYIDVAVGSMVRGRVSWSSPMGEPEGGPREKRSREDVERTCKDSPSDSVILASISLCHTVFTPAEVDEVRRETERHDRNIFIRFQGQENRLPVRDVRQIYI
ncbi:hypothetical protein K0M31_009319 [Melipona bicolor]|uniref:Uncharacterized protein n=1 Tax=Melipona bicolor TaxID=60889 RepID=A0AA40KJT1_9HYME|nr:hypothetical protein K0M31_009319 [Melipona bicolor]